MEGYNFGPAKAQVGSFTGATAQANGDSGLVPAPLIADKDKYLKGDGTWATIPDPSGMLCFCLALMWSLKRVWF